MPGSLEHHRSRQQRRDTFIRFGLAALEVFQILREHWVACSVLMLIPVAIFFPLPKNAAISLLPFPTGFIVAALTSTVPLAQMTECVTNRGKLLCNAVMAVISLLVVPVAMLLLLLPLSKLGGTAMLTGIVVAAALPPSMQLSSLYSSSARGDEAVAFVLSATQNVLGLITSPVLFSVGVAFLHSDAHGATPAPQEPLENVITKLLLYAFEVVVAPFVVGRGIRYICEQHYKRSLQAREVRRKVRATASATQRQEAEQPTVVVTNSSFTQSSPATCTGEAGFPPAGTPTTPTDTVRTQPESTNSHFILCDDFGHACPASVAWRSHLVVASSFAFLFSNYLLFSLLVHHGWELVEWQTGTFVFSLTLLLLTYAVVYKLTWLAITKLGVVSQQDNWGTSRRRRRGSTSTPVVGGSPQMVVPPIVNSRRVDWLLSIEAAVAAHVVGSQRGDVIAFALLPGAAQRANLSADTQHAIMLVVLSYHVMQSVLGAVLAITSRRWRSLQYVGPGRILLPAKYSIGKGSNSDLFRDIEGSERGDVGEGLDLQPPASSRSHHMILVQSSEDDDVVGGGGLADEELAGVP